MELRGYFENPKIVFVGFVSIWRFSGLAFGEEDKKKKILFLQIHLDFENFLRPFLHRADNKYSQQACV